MIISMTAQSYSEDRGEEIECKIFYPSAHGLSLRLKGTDGGVFQTIEFQSHFALVNFDLPASISLVSRARLDGFSSCWERHMNSVLQGSMRRTEKAAIKTAQVVAKEEGVRLTKTVASPPDISITGTASGVTSLSSSSV